MTLGQQDNACRQGRAASAMSKPHKGMRFRPAMPCFMSLTSSSRKPDAGSSPGQQAGSWCMPQVQCSRERLYRAGMFLGSPVERRARILLLKQPSACSLPFSFPGHLWTRLGWGRLPMPNIHFFQGAHKDSPAHTWLTNNFYQVKVSIREGLSQFPECGRLQTIPGFRGLQEARQKPSRWASQATAGSIGTQQWRRSSWPALWHALNEHWDERGQGHRFKRGHGRAEHGRRLLRDQSRAVILGTHLCFYSDSYPWVNCRRPQLNPGRCLAQCLLCYRQEAANGPCPLSSRQQGLPTAANRVALALGKERARQSSPQATVQDRLCPESARHRPQPATDRQGQRGQTLLSPSSLPKSQKETSTGLPSSVGPHIKQLECVKLYTGITRSVHIPSLAEPSCLAQRAVPRPGQPQGRPVPRSAAVPNHQ